jgi:hypothetical protein
MIVTITNENGEVIYDISKIKDDQQQNEARIIVQKTGTLSVVIEALDFASRTHRANLDKLLEGCSEAVVEQEKKKEDS